MAKIKKSTVKQNYSTKKTSELAANVREELSCFKSSSQLMAGVLVAVSIPVFTSQLEKSREATDLANLRAAKAAATVAYLSEESPVWVDTSGNKAINTADLYYNTATGKIDTTGNACGKGTSQNGHCESTAFGGYTYDNAKDVAGDKIKVSITADGDVTCEFVA